MKCVQYVVISIYVLFSVAGVTCFKLGSTESLNISISNTYFSIKISWLSVLGLLLYIVSFLIYMGLISKNQLSYLIPLITGAVYLLTMFSSVIIFKEQIHFFQLAGSALILFGLILMNIKI